MIFGAGFLLNFGCCGKIKYGSTKSSKVTKPPSENGVKKIIGLSVKKYALFELASSQILAKAYDF